MPVAIEDKKARGEMVEIAGKKLASKIERLMVEEVKIKRIALIEDDLIFPMTGGVRKETKDAEAVGV